MDSNHRPHAYQACALTCWAISPYLTAKAVGGDKRIRTADPLLAKQVLYQLSYTPIKNQGAAFKQLPENYIVIIHEFFFIKGNGYYLSTWIQIAC